MSKTIRNRPPWQEERGPRYGNLRSQKAELKVRARRNERANLKSQFRKSTMECM